MAHQKLSKVLKLGVACLTLFGASKTLAQQAYSVVTLPNGTAYNDSDLALPQSSSAEARRIFIPSDFERFAPRTALDMAREIPGFTIRERDGGVRGLGQGDTNILINGSRISGKSNGPVDALSRISAGDIIRLEIVDGASLDVGGLSGQVLNVIVRNRGGISGQFRYSPQFRSSGTTFRWGNAEASISGGDEETSWTLSVGSDQDRFGERGSESVTNGFGVLVDQREERYREQIEVPFLSGSYSKTFANKNILNLTGEVAGYIFEGIEFSDREGAGEPDRLRTLRITEDELNFEVGLDYSFPIADGTLKLIGYHRTEYSPTSSETLLQFSDGSPSGGSSFTRQADEFETIVRAEYGFSVLNGDWQASLEGARNVLDIESELEVRDANGVLQSVDFPGATARVDEDRAEATLTYSRALSPKVQFQGSLGGEYSQIRQSGPFGQSRDFVRPKGVLSVDWAVNEALNVSVSAERLVGQLSFFDFISSVNVNEGQIDGANADLVPPQSWLFETEATHSLGSFGSIVLSGYYESVSDIIDQIPIEGGGQAAGNIDSAIRYGFAADITLLSEPLGWPGTRLDYAFEFNDSELNDPLLRTPRRISGGRSFVEMSGSLRHDLQGTDWAGGFDFEWEEDNEDVRLDEISLFQGSFAFASVFIENKDVAGLTLRARIANVLDRENNFRRTIFDDRANGVIALIEDRSREFGTIFTLDIEGSF